MRTTDEPGKKNFFIRILFPTVVTIALFISVFFLLFIPQFENTITDRKREMIRELTNSAWSIIETWHKAEEAGSVTKEKAQEMAIRQIQHLRYGEGFKDYFWITDYSPSMVVHPYRPELNNKDLSEFTDSRGKKLFVEMAAKARNDGDGYVDYMWQWKDDSTKIVPKLSYVKSFPPWKWIIGTGIYVEDVRKEIAQLEEQIVNVSFGITLTISVLLFFVAYQSLRAEKLRLRAENDLHESKEKYRALVEASTEGLVLILKEGQIFYNKTLYAILGYTEETPSLTLSKLFVAPPKLKSIDISTLEVSPLKSGEPDQAEAIVIKADGSRVSVLVNASHISFLNSSGVVLSVKDISVNKKIEAELDQSKEKYVALTNQLSLGVFRAIASKECHFVESNVAMLTLLGVGGSDALLASSLAEYFEDREGFDCFYTDLMMHRSAQSRPVTLSRSNGSKSTVSISAVLVQDNDGHPLYIDGIVEDISAQNKSNKEKDVLIHELETAFLFLNNSIDTFVKPITRCDLDTLVKDAILRLNREQDNCLLIESTSDNPIGFFTESDIRTRILVSEANMNKPISEFMSSPLITLPYRSSVYDALVKFHEGGIGHLLYRDALGKISGVLHANDLHKLFHSSYLFFVQKIHNASTITELRAYHSQLQFLVAGLIDTQAGVAVIAQMITTVSDAICKRVISLAIEKLGAPPANFSFMALGSMGREEQTLATDQDNAIIFEDVETAREPFAKQYFLRLGEIVSEDLNRIGYDLCKGEVMARNPKWCQPLAEWKNYFTSWVTTADPQGLLDIKIFFDFRSVYGDESLAAELHDHITTLTAGYNSFFVYVSESITQFTMPETALKLKSAFDIKMVMLPIVDTMRLYALKKKSVQTHTIERLADVYEKGGFSKSAHNNVLHVYRFLMHKRFQHQSIMLSGNLKIDNLVHPHEFSDVELVTLKKSYAVIEDMLDKVRLDFKGTTSL